MNVNNLKTLIRLCLALGVFCLLPQQNLKATHIVGGGIRYEILSTNPANNTMTVALELAVYRDCFFGDPLVYFDNPAHIGIFDQANLLVQDFEIAFSGTDDTLTQNLDSFCLVNLEPVCVHRTFYEGTVVLPIIPGGYTFAYQRCCRNETINNIDDPVETGATFLIRLREEAIARANISPEYRTWPPIYVCAGEPLVYDHSAVEPDGDSLVYKLCTPYDGGTLGAPQPIPTGPPPYDTVVWSSGYSLDNILGTGDPLRIDEQTGLITATPGTQGQFVVGVCVEEYDRETGELLSILRRDFQYNVNPCENIAAEFDAPDAQCDDFTVILDNISASPDSYSWFANGELFSTSNESEITQVFPDTGSYVVELIAVPNTICADTFTQTIFLQRNSIVPDFFLAVINCVDSAIIDMTDQSLDTISTIDSYEWIVEYGTESDTLTGENAQATIPLGVSGNITLIVQNVNGCEESFTRPFDSNLPNPTDFILAQRTVCEGETVELNPDAPDNLNFVYQWAPANLLDDPTAQNPVATIAETTTFSVTITNGVAGCETVLTTTINSNDRPTADFSTVEECGGITYVFTNTSTNGVEYFYDFGVDGVTNDTSDLASPTFTFPGNGTYTVNFIVTSAEGCADTLSRDIDVMIDSPINLAIDNNITTCDPQVTLAPTADVPVTFTYTDSDGNVLGTGPTFVVDVSGTTFVTITASDADGCTDVQLVTISGGPVNLAAPDTIINCTGADIMFEVMNLDANDTLTYAWTPASIFDPTTINSPNPTFIGAFGEYAVSVTATNQFGCMVTEDITLIVRNPDAVFSFTAVPDCDGGTVNFTNTGSASFGYSWDFGGLGTSNEENPTFVFPAPGTYTVTLSSEFGNACLTPFTQDVVVSDTVVLAGFNLDPANGTCGEGEVVLNFIEASINQSSSTLTHAWTFSSGTPLTATGPNATVTITESTELTVTLVSTSATGCSDDTTVVIDIVIPEVNLPADVTICPGDSVNLNPDFSADLIYTWMPAGDFDSNDPNPRVGVAGTYIVTASSTDGDINCTTNDTIVVTIADSIELVLVGPDGVIGRDSILNGGNGNGDESDDPDVPVVTTCGETIDLTAQVDANIDVVFTDPDGNVLGTGSTLDINTVDRDTVTATATDEFGCSVSSTVIIINRQVDAGPDGNGQEITLCETQDTMIGVVNLDPEDMLTFAWTPNPIINGPLDGPTVNITPVMEGTETLNVLITNQFGCDTIIDFTVTIQPFEPNDFPTPVDACFNEPTPLNPGGQPVPGYDYEWSPMDGDFSNPANPIVTLTESTNYSVTITDPATGCSESQMIMVNVAPEIAFMAMPTDSTVCSETTVTYMTTNAVGADVTWYSDPDRTMVLSTGDDITLTVTEPGTTMIAYGQAVDPVTGCTEELEVTLTYQPFTPNDFPETVDACFEEPTVIPGGDAIEGYIYTWDPMDGDFSDPANPVVTLSDTTTFTVTITDPITGCEDIQMVTVEVAPEIQFESVTMPTDSVICFPGSVTFVTTNAVGADVTWYSDSARTMVLSMGDEITLTITDPGTVTAYGQAVDPDTGCTEELEVSLTLQPFMPNEYPEVVVACFNEPTVISGGPAIPGYDYTWDPMDGDFSDPANPIVTLTEDATYNVTITDMATMCSSVQEVMVDVAEEIQFTATPADTILCAPGTYTVTGNTAIATNIVWFSDPARTIEIGTGQTIDITLTDPGETVTVYGTATDPETGCDEEVTATGTYTPLTDGLPAETVFGCVGEDAPGLFPNGINPDYTYTYNPPSAVDLSDPANPVWVGDESGTVEVSVFNFATGCEVVIDVDVTMTDLTGLTGMADPEEIILDESSTLTVFGCDDCDYDWMQPNGTINPNGEAVTVVTPDMAGDLVYEVLVTKDGCSQIVEIDLTVLEIICNPDRVYLPNAFSPNGDGANDELRLRSRFIEQLLEFELMVFNRWGQQMYRSFDQNAAWDGRFEGEDLEPDVYGFYLRVVCPDGTELVQKGNITLIR